MLAHDSKPSMLLQQTERDKIYYAESTRFAGGPRRPLVECFVFVG
jgi:hypothetical protein